ncbi:hypothetical protein HPP92_020580 [Vanilla planifolia]|uniref:Wax synthase domain-containing protein n=1 Tax=Vanilla planifolia TaxID=51239 RepID=A0A835Q2Z6_VANPL|nr:hypothetical protein HPP92_020976 [Vanilla planifolia]KAG0462104.1 hypothetical protein HPP92_020580 [Vanilla planifolia]
MMMVEEMVALFKVSFSTLVLMAYSRFMAARTTRGFRRLVSILPVIAVLFFLPLKFSSIHLRGISAFFLAWLAVFKLLLMSFDSGPLSPTLPFFTFLAVAALPVKIRPSFSPPHSKRPRFLPSAIKALLFSVLLSFYSYRDRFPRYLLIALYSFHIYLALELVLATSAFLAGVLLGLDLEPQFDAPYRATSLQDFWGRRWNLMVTSILRPSVYGPVRAHWGDVAGCLSTFIVSGAMHELMFFYITSATPTGEVFFFFVLHGACTAGEVWVKRAAKGHAGEKGRQVNQLASTVMTLGFVFGTTFWLFFPQITRNGSDQRVLEECDAAMRILADGSRAVVSWFGL